VRFWRIYYQGGKTMNEIALKPSYWASVSGGKDSLYMLNLILHNLDKYPLDGVVHFELEIDYPFIKNVIDYMESECKKYGITFVRIKPRTPWKDLYNKYGFPTRIARWCNSSYKLDASRQCDEFLKSQGCYRVAYIGYCADEIKRFENKAGNKEIYPLVDAGINECEILEWAKEVPIFDDYYKFNKRCGCMYCPMISMTSLAYLLKYYPDNYSELMKLAKKTEVLREKEFGRPFSVFCGEPKYNSDYKNKRVHEVYLPKLEEQIRKW
jgi:3'-phosphoadenosine 5'-phosphosulfate sulfotransferase (PAPS reductase)/FAD synthetase